MTPHIIESLYHILVGTCTRNLRLIASIFWARANLIEFLDTCSDARLGHLLVGRAGSGHRVAWFATVVT